MVGEDAVLVRAEDEEGRGDEGDEVDGDPAQLPHVGHRVLLGVLEAACVLHTTPELAQGVLVVLSSGVAALRVHLGAV